MDPILGVEPLGAPPWRTADPFLFCVHHDDDYPAGDARFGPVGSLAGRDLGQDFAGKDGWRMYHGRVVPGFPQHPHRGFETVTVVRRGLLDHADSLGAAARYGRGDVQWLTAGAGIQHAEMFPLLRRAERNPVELFQLWLNLPASRKLAAPSFSMLWAPTIPRYTAPGVEVTVVAGVLGTATPPAPPPDSWAARPGNDVQIWTIQLAPGARWELPARPGTNRALYFFAGRELRVGQRAVGVGHRITLRDGAVPLVNGDAEAELLLLGGRPIGEPVAQHGPFVMNTREELARAYADFRATGFGGWPWDREDPVHGGEDERFARYPDGRVARPG
ncbi:MAG: pirin family protein [Polyangiaceae bacterium]|nr:pirin family protein [Polyangiaceae bacterium]